MHEFNIKDVFRAERLRQMPSNIKDSEYSSRDSLDRHSIKEGMSALMKELLGHTGQDEPESHKKMTHIPKDIIH
jgi:hypothetical protein